MAGNLTDVAENLALDAINGVTGSTVTTPLKLRLMTTLGTDAATGTEVTGGSYSAQTITFGAASGGTSKNTNALTYSGLPTCTVVGFEVIDSAATPRRIWIVPATANRSVTSGDAITVAVNAITVSLD